MPKPLFDTQRAAAQIEALVDVETGRAAMAFFKSAAGRAFVAAQEFARGAQPVQFADFPTRTAKRYGDAARTGAREACLRGDFTQGLLRRGRAERADHLQPARERLYGAPGYRPPDCRQRVEDAGASGVLRHAAIAILV